MYIGSDCWLARPVVITLVLAVAMAAAGIGDAYATSSDDDVANSHAGPVTKGCDLSGIGAVFDTSDEEHPVPEKPKAKQAAKGPKSTPKQKAVTKAFKTAATADEKPNEAPKRSERKEVAAVKTNVRRTAKSPKIEAISEQATQSATIERPKAKGSAPKAKPKAKGNTHKPRTLPKGKGATKRSPPETGSEVEGPAKRLSVPQNCGAFAYAKWVVDTKTSDVDVQAMAKLPNITIGSFCSGMCTEALAFEALRRACPPDDTFPKVTFDFLCEKDPAKLSLLKTMHPRSLHIADATALENDLVTDCDGKCWDKPTPLWLIAGLSCKCLSTLNTKPKSVLGDGPTGETVRAMLKYLESIHPAKRPMVVTIEEVSGLLHQRKCDTQPGIQARGCCQAASLPPL